MSSALHDRSVVTTSPTIIGHRGAPGYLPEHTAASYRLAIAHGVDAVEPDLVITRDGVLVVRHESELSRSTDVARRPEFAGRRATKRGRGLPVTGWFVEDFTLEEIKTLRAVERFPRERPASALHDGRHPVLTFDELLLLVAEESAARGRSLGLHVELKSSGHFAGLGLPLEPTVLASLRDHALPRPGAPVWLQSFEPTSLRALRERTSARLVQLVGAWGAPADCVAAGHPTTYDELSSPRGLRAVARYADAVSFAKDRLIPRESAGPAPGAADLVDRAHLEGLTVLTHTVRSENCFLAACFRSGREPGGHGDVAGETMALLDLGVDAVFTDQPDTTIAARELWRSGRSIPGTASTRLL